MLEYRCMFHTIQMVHFCDVTHVTALSSYNREGPRELFNKEFRGEDRRLRAEITALELRDWLQEATREKVDFTIQDVPYL